ncbi:MAG: porphobilinogen synthase, partial [Coriobacteriia bacterium]|nr:porphobilinogen synthase [Coriobacteriia bacterium]
MHFPTYRPRRLRGHETLRAMVRETQLSATDLIYPLFIEFGEGVRREVASMPGVFGISLDQLPAEIDELKALGVPAVILFGLPESKDEAGTGGYAEDGIVQRA